MKRYRLKEEIKKIIGGQFYPDELEMKADQILVLISKYLDIGDGINYLSTGYKCLHCGEEFESGIVSISQHWTKCWGKGITEAIIEKRKELGKPLTIKDIEEIHKKHDQIQSKKK